MNEKKQKWLKSILEDDDEFNKPLNLNILLENSLYYPCSGFDSSPIDKFAGNIFSFIYVDILTKSKEHLDWIKSELTFNPFGHKNNPNASLVKKRKVKWSEIIPKNWSPSINPTYRDENIEELMRWQKKLAPPRYLYWSIWKKNDDSVQDTDDSRYFSLLYFGGCEMNAAYQALYNRLNIKPRILAILNPGMGFWDCKNVDGIYKTHLFFEKVLKANSNGLPPFLFCVNSYDHPISFIDLYEKVEEIFDVFELLKLKKDFAD